MHRQAIAGKERTFRMVKRQHFNLMPHLHQPQAALAHALHRAAAFGIDRRKDMQDLHQARLTFR